MEQERMDKIKQDEEEEMEVSQIRKAYTIDDITAGMEKTTIGKKKKMKISEDIKMQGDSKKIQKEKNSKNKVLKEKGRKRNTKSQLKFWFCSIYLSKIIHNLINKIYKFILCFYNYYFNLKAKMEGAGQTNDVDDDYGAELDAMVQETENKIQQKEIDKPKDDPQK